MKQARLSFGGTKRKSVTSPRASDKEKRTENSVAKDVAPAIIEVLDSPKKASPPPTKKVRLSQINGTPPSLGSLAKIAESSSSRTPVRSTPKASQRKPLEDERTGASATGPTNEGGTPSRRISLDRTVATTSAMAANQGGASSSRGPRKKPLALADDTPKSDNDCAATDSGRSATKASPSADDANSPKEKADPSPSVEGDNTTTNESGGGGGRSDEDDGESTPMEVAEPNGPDDADTDDKDDNQHGGQADAVAAAKEPSVLDVSHASGLDSSVLDTTISSDSDARSDEEDRDADTAGENCATRTKLSPKPKRKLSKTEAAYRELKRRKTQQFRDKDREEQRKRKEAERMKREAERKEAKEKKERERLEKERKREEERLERERRKEEERLEKEREREEKEKLRKERERRKEEERLEKEREREEKERLRKEKEDEKRKKEDERRREVEEEMAKKQKAKQAFMSFFVKTPSPLSSSTMKTTTTGESGLADHDDPAASAGAAGHDLSSPITTTGTASAAVTSGRGNTEQQSCISVTGGERTTAGSGTGAAARFKPFQPKKDMQLAAIVPPAARKRFDRKLLEQAITASAAAHGDNGGHGDQLLYLAQLKRPDYSPLTTAVKQHRSADKDDNHKNNNSSTNNYRNTNTNNNNNNSNENDDGDDDDCVVVLMPPQNTRDGDDAERAAPGGGRMRAKLLQFVENYRPAYYGTWRKTCPQVTGRRPFSKYADFDYSVDSDDEWEDVEGEVESLAGTDDEKDKEETGEEDYEEDDFFVPHGYLSESEEDESEDQPLDPAVLKARIAARQEEFIADRRAGLQPKKMVAVCSVGPGGRTLEAECKVLQQFRAVLLIASEERPLKPSWEREPDITNTPLVGKAVEHKLLTGDALRVFCEAAHGFQGGVRQLYDLFFQRWRAISDVKVGNKSLKLTLTSSCKKSKNNRLVVNADLVHKFGLKEVENEDSGENTHSLSAKLLPDDVIPDLIRVAHGSSKTAQVVTDFLNIMKEQKFGKAQVKRTLRSIAAFEHVQSCWLVKSELLKVHNLEGLNEKIKVEEKIVKEKKDNRKKEPKDTTETVMEIANDGDQGSNEDCLNSKESTNDAKGKENVAKTSTPKVMSIKKFFNSAKNSVDDKTNSSSSTDVKASTPQPSIPVSDGTPKVKKRLQLTTLSRVSTLKPNPKPQPVLNQDEVMVIEDSND